MQLVAEERSKAGFLCKIMQQTTNNGVRGVQVVVWWKIDVGLLWRWSCLICGSNFVIASYFWCVDSKKAPPFL